MFHGFVKFTNYAEIDETIITVIGKICYLKDLLQSSENYKV